MKLFNNDKGQVDMIPLAIYIFVLIISLYFLIFNISPLLGIIETLTYSIDPDSSLQVSGMSAGTFTNFTIAIKAFFFMITLMVVSKLIHLFLLAIKKQRYTGGNTFESDFN